MDTGQLTGRRIALVTNIPRPYRIPLYEGLGRAVQAAQGEFKVFFYSNPERHVRRETTHSEGVAYHYVNARSLEFHVKYDQLLSFPIGLIPLLRQFRPHLLISGAFGIPGSLSWLYTRLHKIPYIQWSGATLARAGKGLSPSVQGFLARRADACITYGTAAREYLVAKKAPHSHLVVGMNTVDTQFFTQASIMARDEVSKFKEAHNLRGVNFLYVGNLFQLKGVSYALEALRPLQEIGDYHFHVVGKGPQCEELQQQAETSGLTQRVHFWGAQPPEKIPFYYALADVFVFPSLYDVWGLVLNEAMACGLPVIASSVAGATRDLVVDGENGFVIDPRNEAQFTEALRRLLLDADLRRQMGQRAAATIQAKATIQHSVQAFMQAIQLAFEHPSR